jgi:predicted kinase
MKCAYASSDEYVEAYSRSINKTYSEVFDLVIKDAISAMAETVMQAKSMQQDIIWDQTSVSVNSRAKKFRILPNYEHIAVVFKTPEPDELARRLAGRPGKTIPDYVIRSMIENFEMPTKEEGFTEIWYV